MLYAKNVMVLVLVHVYLNISEIHTPDADLNVFKTQTVIGRKHVSAINAKILVLESVE
jgi:hypothetical protein